MWMVSSRWGRSLGTKLSGCILSQVPLSSPCYLSAVIQVVSATCSCHHDVLSHHRSRSNGAKDLCTKVSEAMNQYKNLTPLECFSQIFGHSHGKVTNACCMHVNTHRCMHIRTHRCMRVNTRLCMHINTHLCMHVNTQLAVKCLGERDRIIVYICTCCTKLKYQAGKAW